MKAAGQWNTAWEPFQQSQLDGGLHRCRAPVYISGVLSPKLAELLSIAFDASVTHMYAPGATPYPERPQGGRLPGGNHGGAEDLCRRKVPRR